MNFSTSLRDKRHFYGPTHYSIANYCTDTRNVMKPTFGDEYFFDNLHHLIPETLKKDLADTINEEKMLAKNEFSKIDMNDNKIRNDTSPLAGITNFLSGVMNVISGAMFFSKRKTDSSEIRREMAPECAWQPAKIDDENKILQDESRLNDESDGKTAAEMADCKAAAVHCQNKLDQVRFLLSKPIPCTVKVKRRPRKVFVETGSVEDSFVDAFAPEDFERQANNSYLEYVSPSCYHDDDLHEISAPKVRTESPLSESTEIIKNLPEKVFDKVLVSCNDKNDELIASCEDKLSKLKALLQERKKVVVPEPLSETAKEQTNQKPVSKIKDKHYKNSKRSTDKRRKSKMRQNINNDLLFANEINTDDLSSVENSPSLKNINNIIPKPTNLEYFDEISGRFRSASFTDSEDSFQIVFNDSPRLRRQSDCESEDSFIVFDDSQDSCYTTNDVFKDSSDSDSCDSDSDLSDSGCGNFTFKLSHSLSKSVGNLADDSLYNNISEDEVDCSKVSVCEVVTDGAFNSGLLLDSRKKECRRSQPPKKVQFSSQPPKVHVMRVWAFAAKQARAGHWERYALDRERFKRRIADVEVAVSWVLRPQHRSRVMFQRFMPWWNAEKRRELAEKKREEETKAQEQVRLQERVAEDTVGNNSPDASTNELQKRQDVIKNDLQEDVGEICEGVVNKSNVTSSLSELDEEATGDNYVNQKLVNLDALTSKDDSLRGHKELSQGENNLEGTKTCVNCMKSTSDYVQVTEVDNAECDNSNHQNLQCGEVNHRVDESPKFGEAIHQKYDEFDTQVGGEQEMKHKAVGNDHGQHIDDDLKANNLACDNESTDDHENTSYLQVISKNNIVNDLRDDNVDKSYMSMENYEGTNDTTRNDLIVQCNDKIVSIDLVAHPVRNA